MGGTGCGENWVLLWWAGPCSVQFSRSVLSDSLQPHELQHARPPCPSPAPRVHSDSCSLSQWCHSDIYPLSSPSPPAPNPSQHQGLLLFIRAPEFTHPSKLKLRSLWPTCPHFPHSILWVQLFYILHIIEIIQCLSFCAWFISLNIMFPRFIHVVTNGKISFLSMVE